MRRIAYVTDLHLEEQFPEDQGVNGWQNWNLILDDIRQQGITEIVIGGDIGESSAYPRFFESLKGLLWKVTLGNHDSYGDMKQFLPQTAGSGESLFWIEEDEAFRYLFLDTSPDHLSTAQFQWLQPLMETDKNIIVFLHHPVLGVDTMVDKLYPLQNRDEVKGCLLQSKRPVVLFCGHYHLAHEQTEGTIRQVITPACSFQMVESADEVIVDAGAFGYRIITLTNGEVETRLRVFKNESAGRPVVIRL